MDKGIKKAVSSQMAPRLASNFTYRTLERIRQEEARREARREKRQFALMLVCVFLMLLKLRGRFGWASRNIFRGCRTSSTCLPDGYDRRRFCAAGCSLLATVGDIQLLAAEEIQAFIEVIR